MIKRYYGWVPAQKGTKLDNVKTIPDITKTDKANVLKSDFKNLTIQGPLLRKI